MARILPVLLLIFKVWLLVDVHKKRMPQYWFFIIFFVPFGDVVYFFMHKIKDFKFRKWFESPPSLAEVEYRYQATPSINNRIVYAKALYDAGRRADACWHFDGVLAQDSENLDALYGKAVCLIEQGAMDDAIDRLRTIIDHQPSFRDFQVWTDLANAQWDKGDREGCLETLRQLVRTRTRLDHQLALAQCLIQMGMNGEAQEIVARALSEYDHSPAHTQRLYRNSARSLRKLRA